MIRKVIFSILLLATLPFTSTGSITLDRSESRITTWSSELYSDERQILDLVNRERKKARLSELDWDDHLAELARSYSRKMSREGFFDHYDNQGKTVIDRAQKARITNWARIGENLFVCDPIERLANFAVRGWMRSTTHRENILDREWNASGVGIAVARDGSVYITQVFVEE